MSPSDVGTEQLVSAAQQTSSACGVSRWVLTGGGPPDMLGPELGEGVSFGSTKVKPSAQFRLIHCP